MMNMVDDLGRIVVIAIPHHHGIVPDSTTTKQDLIYTVSIERFYVMPATSVRTQKRLLPHV
jgi:hypothetical protein